MTALQAFAILVVLEITWLLVGYGISRIRDE
jgi:hypothetical protein